MGMYDDINTPDIKCPVCGELLGGFQSKDGPCMLGVLDFWEVRRFYTHCDKCETWVEFERGSASQPVKLSDYNMSMSVYIRVGADEDDYDAIDVN